MYWGSGISALYASRRYIPFFFLCFDGQCYRPHNVVDASFVNNSFASSSPRDDLYDSENYPKHEENIRML